MCSAGYLLDLPVLVLNANYEPLGVCNTRRAMTLLLAQKAENLLARAGKLHTSRTSFDMPYVLRLMTMVHAPRSEVKLTKTEIFRRDLFTCQYCGTKELPLTIDHVFPRHRGGKYVWENVVAACSACNRRKGDQTPEEAHMPLRNKPRRPSATARYRFGHYLYHNSEWAPYLDGW